MSVMKGLKVTHICRTGWPQLGGMETMIRELTHRQIEAGAEVTVLTGRLPGEPPSRDGAVRYERRRRLGPARYPMLQLLPRDLRGDIVHIHGVDGTADAALSSRRDRAPIGVSTHGGYFHQRRQLGAKKVFLKHWTRRSLRRAEGLWFTSSRDAQIFERGGLKGDVVTNGVDLTPWKAIHREPQIGHWVAVGRVAPHKGHADLLRCLASARNHGVRATLTVLGPFSDEGLSLQLRSLTAELGLTGVVDWRGGVSREELFEAYRSCEFAFFPSHAEGFGIGVVEAMASGVAPIARPIPAFQALVGDRSHDWLDFSSPHAGQELTALRNKRHGTEAGARRAAARWSWDAVFPSWERAYQSLLETR